MKNTNEAVILNANKLKAVFRRCGYSSDEIMLLSKDDTLASVRNVLRGLAEIRFVEHPINFWQNDWEQWVVKKHRKDSATKIEHRGDDLYINGKKVELLLFDEQKGKSVISGHVLRKKLSKKSTLGTDVLDHLLRNPRLIPNWWKHDENGENRYISFWGTTYCSLSNRDNSCVCILLWDSGLGQWTWGHQWISDNWGYKSSAAVLEDPDH